MKETSGKRDRSEEKWVARQLPATLKNSPGIQALLVTSALRSFALSGRSERRSFVDFLK